MEVARLGGFEPPTSGSGDQRQNAMLMILLAQSCTLDHGFVRYSALNGPKTDPSFLRRSPKGNHFGAAEQPGAAATPAHLSPTPEVAGIRARGTLTSEDRPMLP